MVEDVSNAEALAILDGLSENEIVLHGSSAYHNILRPFLPVQNPYLIKEYGKKAVYGTLMTEIALLYAVIHEPQDQWGWTIDPQTHPHLFVYGPKRMRAEKGHVYICSRRNFNTIVPPGLVCLSSKQVKPKRVLSVQPNILEVLLDTERLAFR